MTRYLLFLLAAAGGAQAFIASPATSGVSSSSALFSTEIPEIPKTGPRDIYYGEMSRQFRRDVYSHNEWVKHRASDRFIRNIFSILFSGVYKNIGKEVAASVGIATLVVVFNALVGEYTDFEGVKHAGYLSNMALPILSCPLTPFTLSSPSLGLLLVFRTNQSYRRWDEARKNWGMNINHTRDLVRMGNAYYDRQGVTQSIIRQDLDRLALCTWAFVRAMKRHLSPEWEDEQAFKSELYEKLPKGQAQKILDAAHRPNRALQDLSVAIEALPMNFIRKNEIHKAATIFEDNLGSSERLLTSPVPLFYTRHTARFVAIWLLLLPFGFYDTFASTWNHIGLIPATFAISVALFGIDELASQLEEPFTILPMQAFCDKIYNWCTEIVSFDPNDNAMFDDEYVADIQALKAGEMPAPKAIEAAPVLETPVLEAVEETPVVEAVKETPVLEVSEEVPVLTAGDAIGALKASDLTTAPKVEEYRPEAAMQKRNEVSMDDPSAASNPTPARPVSIVRRRFMSDM